MQKALDTLQEYCNLWKWSVNSSKTKVIVFSKIKGWQNCIAKLNGAVLEIVDSLTYLGIDLKYNGHYFDARKKLVEQSQKSLFAIYKKIRNQNIPMFSWNCSTL
jgi:hypothetical protein